MFHEAKQFLAKIGLENCLRWTYKKAFIAWLVCIGAFLILAGLNFDPKRKPNSPHSSTTDFLYSIVILAGIFFFSVQIFTYVWYKLLQFKFFKKPSKRHFAPIVALLVSAVFPLYLIYRQYKDKNSDKFVKSVGIFIFLLPLWLLGDAVVILGGSSLLGIVKPPVQIIGASMLPTLDDGQYFNLNYRLNLGFFRNPLKRGDIVTFENSKTNGKLLIKRVIAIGGNKIVIKNGYIYVNDKIVEEPYTLKPRSTFGSDFIKDCQEFIVPNGKVFVLGDNRKRSVDSRNLGLIDDNDIKSYLHYYDQGYLKKRWRKSDKTQGLNSSILDSNRFVDQLNAKRKANNVPELRYDQRLSRSAELRGNNILKFDDFSWEATRSGYTMAKAMADAGYYNIVYGEYPILGYYDAQELIDNIFEDSNGSKFLLNREYQDIGISTFIGELNGCPVQIVVQHLAGYIPPNYNKSDIEGWKNNLSRLREILPSWENIKNYSETYYSNRVKSDRLIEIIKLRILRIERIASRMESNQWLTSEEKVFVDQDKALYDEQVGISKELNNIRWK